MAKQLGEVRLLVFGDGSGPSRARFEYMVSSTDDPSLVKYAGLDVDTPSFELETVDAFFDGYVAVIKENEGIV